MNFLPNEYEVPKAPSNYVKLEKGQNKFRVVSSAIIGYEYWTTENKPVRLKYMPDVAPTDIRKDSKVKHFWAFVVIDRKDNKIKVMELTQASIMKQMKKIVDSEEWGDPKGYDFTINREGDGLETEYTVQPSPHKELTTEEMAMVEFTKVNLEALFEGENPFETTSN